MVKNKIKKIKNNAMLVYTKEVSTFTESSGLQEKIKKKIPATYTKTATNTSKFIFISSYCSMIDETILKNKSQTKKVSLF